MVKGQYLHPQTQQCILHLLEYFKEENLRGGPLLPLSRVQDRVAQALKISTRCISRVTRAGAPVARKLTKSRASVVTNMSEATKSAIKDMIHTLYAKNEVVTHAILREKLHEAGIYSASRTCLFTVLRSIGYKWEHVAGSRSWKLVEGKTPKKTAAKTSKKQSATIASNAPTKDNLQPELGEVKNET